MNKILILVATAIFTSAVYSVISFTVGFTLFFVNVGLIMLSIGGLGYVTGAGASYYHKYSESLCYIFATSAISLVSLLVVAFARSFS